MSNTITLQWHQYTKKKKPTGYGTHWWTFTSCDDRNIKEEVAKLKRLKSFNIKVNGELV